MNINAHTKPRPYIIIDNFLTSEGQEKIWEEIKENESKFKDGLFLKNGKEVHTKTKKNLQFKVTPLYKNVEDSYIRSMFYSSMFRNPNFLKTLDSAREPIFSLLRYTISDMTKVSVYNEGDYYDWHVDQTDRGLITVLYMMCKEPQKFTGGDLQLKWNDDIGTIPFKNNSVVIFPRNTLHRVTEIKMKSNEFYDRRFTVQCFANFRK